MVDVPANIQKPAPKRRGRVLILLCLATMAGLAAMLSPFWLPLVTEDFDTRAISIERAQRHWRASMGLAMPGEPNLARLSDRLAEIGLAEGAPVMVRIFKREFELELWMKRDGLFHRFAIYPICRWSGGLGPKVTQGDRQAPEGFYTVDQNALNPQSRWRRSFDLGYPNAYDRSFARTGSLIMVHGGCASAGCFAMTNAQIDEIWKLVTGALSSGQKRFQVQVYPFRMSEEKLASYAGQVNESFWRNLKRGSDLFEATLLPPKVYVCRNRYEFEPGGGNPDGDGTIEARCPPATPKS